MFSRPRHWERLHEKVSEESHGNHRRFFLRTEFFLTPVCVDLQRHPLEPAGGEEDDRRHQLAAQSSPDHDLEPCLHGDSCLSTLFLCIKLVAFSGFVLCILPFASLQPPSIMSFPATTPTGMMGYGMVSGNAVASASTDIYVEFRT